MTSIETRARSGRFKLLKIYPNITSEFLLKEIERRRIPYDLANIYLRQVFVLDRKSQMKRIAFAFENKLHGFEINIPFPAKGTSFKGSVDGHSYTFIEGENAASAEIFLSFWDFLTWLVMLGRETPNCSAYILNGTKSVEGVITNIQNRKDKIKSVVDFLDNDDTCEEIRFIITDAVTNIGMRYGAQNYLYVNFKDLSEYWMNDPDASSHWPIKPEQPKIYNDTAWNMVMGRNKTPTSE